MKKKESKTTVKCYGADVIYDTGRADIHPQRSNRHETFLHCVAVDHNNQESWF